MSDAEHNLTETPETVDWKERYTDLSRQLAMLRAGILVASLTFTAYLFVQNRRMSKDTDVIRPQLQQVMDASKKDANNLQAFAEKLSKYGEAHPEFAPILNKYGIRPALADRVPPAPTLSLPPATPPKK